ncbi:uncharacterized protein FOMMEDRAFT_22795 [Fomitiporia mediterranea MF3/22]|uniref:uncharacterized protein n=1 Tax=Fomitiporia mediterranea (strain MF3/22) TaxID=694068 RepID=UPI00044081F6|nr:uncharacterized protein FOMMEDRAFT_22795 [Fomitiporia mediterranea MF3/22]EJC99684.1 hypothetical protein FOMMEDRAFT_22795 [Fomitiporia mediterranea MF3/22]
MPFTTALSGDLIYSKSGNILDNLESISVTTQSRMASLSRYNVAHYVTCYSAKQLL